MIKYIKRIDTFGKNIILVFLGTSLVNIFNLLYQLLIAHRMSVTDFAGFNSLLAIFTLISAPLITLQIAVAKYTVEFKAKNQIRKIQTLLSNLIRKIFPLAVITFVIFYFLSFYIMDKLKISSLPAGYMLALLLASSWFAPVLTGALQGLELFKWLMALSIIAGVLKLIFTYIFINLGFNIAGALGAFVLASLIGIIVSFLPLKSLVSFKKIEDGINLKEFCSYLAPVAVSLFCFIALVNFDMVLVKYLFSPLEAGFYSLAQMLGKIFLFLPGAISIVMFPKAAGLKAKNMNTDSTLRRSLLYGCSLCIVANLFYNFFPFFTLRILTGKVFYESVILARLFGISMSFFTLLHILINYFLSIKDLRFMKYLILSALLQPLAIILLHKTLIHVQFILCINSILLFFIHLLLAYKKGTVPAIAN
ncbi:MAG: oligosaccharide flippase family protein [Candidatus Omnitrophota bacterium]|nr:oligosaccharide flippase family protein [Candidatus Omnitrophota bacterium]